MTLRFWKVSALMKQVQRAEVMYPRSHSPLVAQLGSEPKSLALSGRERQDWQSGDWSRLDFAKHRPWASHFPLGCSSSLSKGKS